MLSEFLKVTNFIQIHLFLNPSLLEKRLKGDHFMQTSCGSLFAQRIILKIFNHLLCCSVTKSFPTLWSHGLQHAKPPWPSPSSEFAQIHVHCIGDAGQSLYPLIPSFTSALSLFQHQGFFQWVACSHQMNKIQELQLQRQSFQWIFRVDLL